MNISAERNKVLLNLSFFYAMFLFGINYGMVSPILIELSEKIGSPIAVMGNFFSMTAAGFITGSILSSILSRFNIRKIVFLSFYILLPVSIIAIAFSYNYFFLLLSGFFMGITNGLLESNITVVLAETNKGREAQYINNSQALFGFGAFAGPMISTILVKSGISIRNAFIFIAVLCFLNLIFFLFLKIPSGFEHIKEGASTDKKSLKKDLLLKHKTNSNIFFRNMIIVAALFLAMFAYGCSEGVINSWLPTYLRLEKNFSALLSGNTISFFWLSVTIGRIVIGFFSRKIRSTYILFAITIMTIAAFKLGTYFSAPAAASAMILITGFFLAGIWPLIVSLGVEFFPRQSSTFLPIVIMAGGAGTIFSPWLAGVIYANSNLSRAIDLIFLFIIILIAFFSFLLYSDIRYFKKKV